MKRIILFLLLFMLPIQAQALTGRVLAIVCDKLGIAKNDGSYRANNTFYRCAEVQGWKYDVCVMSDSAFTKSLWPAGYVFSAGDTATGSRYGDYDMAVMLNMPSPAWIASDANCITYGMAHFGQWIDRSSRRAFPIPLFVPMYAAMDVTGVYAKAYTGALAIGAAFTSGKGEPYKDAQGDSLYLLTNSGNAWALVAEADSTGYSFSHPLMWRHTPGRANLNAKNAAMWMTVGTGNHRVIWLPHADMDLNTINWLSAFAMFTKVRPIEIPVMAYAFGKTKPGDLEAGADTVQYGAGFKRNVDYAVANGIKLELLCYPYYMKTYAVTANNAQALAYAAAYPDNIRLTLSSSYGWGPYAEDLSIIGSAGTYSQKVKRLQQVQDSCDVYFPTISTTRLNIYGGRFIDPTYGRVDSALYALSNRGITDVYNWGTADQGEQYPASTTYGVVGPQRTWIKNPAVANDINEMRFHSIGHIMRYTIQENSSAGNSADWLKTAYVDTAGTAAGSSSVRRANTNAVFLNYCIGNYTVIAGTSTSTRDGTLANARRATTMGDFQVGMFLPALTFSGGSKTTWLGANKAVRRGKVDSTQSVFLNQMKQLNAMKKMGDYLVDTYGTSGSEPFKWSWLSDVLWDRRNGRPYPNSHIKME